MTQEEAAHVVDVTRETWSGWEGGAPVASRYHPAIEKLLGVRFDIVSTDEAGVLDAAREVLDARRGDQ